MAESTEFPVLHVEGSTDLHTICQLLARHAIALHPRFGPVVVNETGGDDHILGSMRNAVKASAERPVGFVIDANGSVADRWQSIQGCLSGLDISLPATPPPSGFIGVAASIRARVGVWIMPDNETDAGQFEHLVQTLVPTDDALFEHARSATQQAVALDERFVPQDRLKAELHCWLAWQREPGRPFGTAIKAHYFRHDSEVAIRFVTWFTSLFIESLPDPGRRGESP